MRATPAIATGLVALAASAAIAGGATTKPTVKAVQNAAVGKKVVVDAKKAMTLYYLTGDTKARKCSNSTCTGFWPPLTVRSLHTKVVKGKGINGKLTVFKRPDGKFQVALRGKPLYHFVGDSAKGNANGEGIVSFGGTWHAMPAAGY
jgi:predicted lipoprotein with Yx(FWY)xxD motif